VKRRALSSRLIGEKIVFFILLIVVLLFCIKHYPGILFVAVPVLVCLDYLIYYRPNYIEFDDDRLFIKRKKGIESVALKDVYLVKMTLWGIGTKSLWRIKYSTPGKDGVVRFYPRANKANLVEFMTLVKACNPLAAIIGIF
jgi:hypothetical protein